MTETELTIVIFSCVFLAYFLGYYRGMNHE